MIWKTIRNLESNIKGYIDLATAKIQQDAEQCKCNREILQALERIEKGKTPIQDQKKPITPFDDPSQPKFANWQNMGQNNPFQNPFVYGQHRYQ